MPGGSPFPTFGLSISREPAMHGVLTRMLLHQLLDEAGGDRAEAARRVGVGRTTMYRWIKAGLLDQPVETIQARYAPRPASATKLEKYTALIEARLAEFPRLSGTRLLTECRAAGYTGGVTQLRAFVRRLRPAPEPLIRFETEPGQQAQVDWAHCRLPWGVRYALVVVLGYSRLLWMQFYPRQDLATLMLGLDACFTAWGGTVKDLLFDQMRSVLTRDDRLTGGGLVHNLELLRFARHWGCRVRVCRPYRAQTKGKVERPIRYLRDSFLYGRTFLSDADLNAQVLEWLATVANVRQHATTHWIPAEQFAQVERPLLLPPPSRPYQSLVLSPPRTTPRAPAAREALPQVTVERRELSAYAALAAGGDA
jgi:transposase